jgi:phosphohistidine swiveling domain-containing protein
MLGELLARGFPVPDGFCLSIPAYRQSGENLQISPQLESALTAASARLLFSNRFLAVRSSAGAEDLPGMSFAGTYQSVIGISKPDEIDKAVQIVWKSYNDPPAVSARLSLEQDEPSGGMGVLIQPVVNAEVAGVCFSVDPVQPDTKRLVINASWGLGVGVVDGSIPSDTLWLNREELTLVDQRIVDKDARYKLDPEAGLVRKPVSAYRRRIECLPSLWARQIAQFTMAAEQVFGLPQDVEWAIADGKVWILQSRPIASLNDHKATKNNIFPVRWENPGDKKRLWKRFRFEHKGNSPFIPLEIDYLHLLESTRLETCLFMGEDRNGDSLVTNGHVYTSHAPLPLSDAERRVRKQAMKDLEARLIREGRTAWDHWGPEIEQANERLTAVDIKHMDGPGLADFLEEAMAVRSRHSMLHPMLWFKPTQSYFDAYQALTGLSGTEAESAAYRLLEGEESPLTRLIDGLYHLAEKARDLPAVADWMQRVSNDPNSQSWPELTDFPIEAPGAAGWIVLFNSFMSEFGDRSGSGYGSEALITTPTWREHPHLIVQLAAQFLDDNEVSPSVRRQQSRQVADAEIDELCKQCEDRQAVETFLRQLFVARKAQAVVEIHNHHIEQISQGQLRRAVLAASSWLQSAGILPDEGAVFWLTFSEIIASLRNSDRISLKEIIHTRRDEFQEWAHFEPPPYIGLPSALLPPRPADKTGGIIKAPQSPGQIHGMGASAGVVSGHARVIKKWEPVLDFAPGAILVAKNAGPIWLPYFPLLAGIVLEEGSLGQHAASTAREYGIPAVISAHQATRKIEDGDWITIDGENGIVTYQMT